MQKKPEIRIKNDIQGIHIAIMSGIKGDTDLKYKRRRFTIEYMNDDIDKFHGNTYRRYVPGKHAVAALFIILLCTSYSVSASGGNEYYMHDIYQVSSKIEIAYNNGVEIGIGPFFNFNHYSTFDFNKGYYGGIIFNYNLVHRYTRINLSNKLYYFEKIPYSSISLDLTFIFDNGFYIGIIPKIGFMDPVLLDIESFDQFYLTNQLYVDFGLSIILNNFDYNSFVFSFGMYKNIFTIMKYEKVWETEYEPMIL